MDEASPDSNFGGGANLYIRSQGGVLGAGDRRLYASFDLSQLPADAAELLTATLRLHPEEASVLERTLRCHEVTGAWTEGGITWNTQPATDANHGTQLSTDDPQDWDVLATAQASFPDGRVEVRVKDDTEGSTDAPEQQYASREGTGTEPELVIAFKKGATSDLSSTVTPSNDRFADLDTDLTVQRSNQRYRGFRTYQPVDAVDNDAIAPAAITYDVDRDLLWITDNVEVKVHRVNREGTTEATHELAFPASSGMGVAYDGTDLWFVTSGELQRWSIQTDGLTHEETITLEGDETVVDLAWDGTHLWTVADFAEEVHKRDTDGTKLRTETVDDVESMAFDAFNDNPLLLEGPSEDRQIVERDLATFAEVNRWDSTLTDAIEALTVEERDRQVAVWIPFWDTGELHRFPSGDLRSSVTLGKLMGTGDLATTVQPANIDGHADLATQVKAGIGGDVDLSTSVTPQPAGHGDLEASVQPGSLPGSSDLTTTVQPAASSLQTQGRVEGSVAPRIEVQAADFAEISAEIGSEITHTQDGASTSLRRVVQLVDTQTAKSFPREATSEHGRASTQDKLGRGDAILYAKQGDAFEPGDQIEYDGLEFEVVGGLGFELVGDERIYQEVGLRRVSIVARGRVRGVVQRSSVSDLVSEVTVNVP